MKRSRYELSDFVPVKSLQETLYDLVERVKRTRKEQKSHSKKLSQVSAVSYASIRRLETAGEISLKSLLNIANALDCLTDFDLLFKEKPVTDLETLLMKKIKDVNKVIVRFNPHVVGYLATIEGKIHFQYADSWLKMGSVFRLSI